MKKWMLAALALFLTCNICPVVSANHPGHANPPGQALGHQKPHLGPHKAGHRLDGINVGQGSQQGRQQRRIAAGAKQGDLTRREALALRLKQKRLNRYEDRSHADGPGMTPIEHRRLDRMQSRQNHAIHNQRQDEQTR